MPTNESTSINEVLEMQPGSDEAPTWLNDVEAQVVSIEKKTTKAGKPYWPCQLADAKNPVHSITMTMWTAPKFSDGSVITIGGKGTRLTEFNSDLQITLGKQSEVHVTSSGARRSAEKPANHTPAPKDDSRGANGAEAAQRPGDISEFHKTMKRMALMYCHAMDYAAEIDKRSPFTTPEQQQACVSTLFIEGARRGLIDIVIPRGAATAAPAAPKPTPAPKPAELPDEEDVPF